MLLTLAEENEANHEQMDFLCSFLHRSIYKSLIPENFLDFDQSLDQEFQSFDAEEPRKRLFQEILQMEIVKNNAKMLDFVKGEADRQIERLKGNQNNSVCLIF